MAASPTILDRQQRVQRVKVGLLGLAAVLLLIGLASAVFNAVDRERPVAAVGSARPATVAAIAGNASAAIERTGNEPLAELGASTATAPGNETTSGRR